MVELSRSIRVEDRPCHLLELQPRLRTLLYFLDTVTTLPFLFRLSSTFALWRLACVLLLLPIPSYDFLYHSYLLLSHMTARVS
jgi:hypothetical protein